MRLEDYTPDAICLAMGLPGFRNDAALRGTEPSLRLLLRPSFHPEVCVTLLMGATEGTAEVRTFPELFWHMPSPAYRPVVFAERVAIACGVVANLARGFTETARLLQAPGRERWMVLDGMPVSVWGRFDGVETEVDLNVGAAGELRLFVAGAIREIYAVLSSGRCRNGLAIAGEYVDLRLKVDALPEVNTATRLLVLGDEEGRKEVGDRLNREQRARSGRRGDTENSV
jgi:hypothetical protein